MPGQGTSFLVHAFPQNESVCDSLQRSGIIDGCVSVRCRCFWCMAHTGALLPHDVPGRPLLRVVPVLVVAADFHRVIDRRYRIGHHLQNTGAVHDMPRVRTDRTFECVEAFVDGK